MLPLVRVCPPQILVLILHNPLHRLINKNGLCLPINLQPRSTSSKCLLFDQKVQSWVTTENYFSVIYIHPGNHGSYWKAHNVVFGILHGILLFWPQEWRETQNQHLPGVGFEPTPPTGDQKTQSV